MLVFFYIKRPITQQIYTVETGTPVKNVHFTSISHTHYSVDITIHHCKSCQCLHFSTVLGAAMKCRQYSGITVESGTPVKSLEITLNIFAV